MGCGVGVVDLGRAGEEVDGELERLFGFLVQGGDLLPLLGEDPVAIAKPDVLRLDASEHLGPFDGAADDVVDRDDEARLFFTEWQRSIDFVGSPVDELDHADDVAVVVEERKGEHGTAVVPVFVVESAIKGVGDAAREDRRGPRRKPSLRWWR